MIITITSKLKPNFKIWPTFLHPKHYSHFSNDQELISLLKSCNQTSEISKIHGSMIKTGLDLKPFTQSKLLASSIIEIEYADSIFSYIQNPNLFMFNTMLRGYSISDNPKQALVLFNYMRVLNIELDQFSFISILKSCACLSAIWIGQSIHSVVIRSGFDLFVNVKNTLLNLYCVCGKIGDAHKVFDEFPQHRDLVSWNTLMSGFIHVYQPDMVVDIFKQLCRTGLRIGVTTVLSVLLALGDLRNVWEGQSVHGYCMKLGFDLDLNVATALIGMYMKTGYIESGRRVFDETLFKDVVLWNCLVNGYAKNGLLEESIALLRLMKLKQVKPNSSTLVGLLSACAGSGALATGRCIQNYMEEEKLVLDTVLGTALVDMYAKCGLLENAIWVFNSMRTKDVKSWTAMISGFGVHGQARNAIELFHRMEKEGFRPNEITFLAVLSACSHGGFVNEGMSCFERMVQKYGLKPRIEHYGSMIDLLGRAGLLEEAHKLVKVKGDSTSWRSLLAACRVHGNIGLGENVKRVLEESYGEHPADSMVLSGMFAIAGRLQDHISTVEMEGKAMKEGEDMVFGMVEEKMVKEAGCSAIELES